MNLELSKLLRHVVSKTEAGQRLDRVLEVFAEIPSRSFAERLIGEGRVTVEGRPAQKSLRLHPGDLVEVRLPPPREVELRPEPVPFRLLYRDPHLLVVSKPAGVVVHPAPGHPTGTLVHGLLGVAELAPGLEATRPGIVHRLDRDTSGLMIVALTLHALDRLGKQITTREVAREYLALVAGSDLPEEGRIEAPVGRHAVDRKKMAVTPRGRPAITRFRVGERFLECTLLEVALETGRTHQIRVHLAHIRHPVVGDPVYGGKGPLSERLGIRRQFLHAFRLKFAHPETGEEMAFEDPLPEDLSDALGALKKS